MKPIVILGMSIAGLVAALEAIQSNKNILMIERHQSFSRNQTVVIVQENEQYFKKLYDQINSLRNKPNISQKLIAQFNKIYHEHINDKAIAIKYLQRLLFLGCQIAASIFIKSRFNYLYEDHYQIQSIDVKNQTLKLYNIQENKTENVEFQHLVDATGINRVTLKYSENWPEKPIELISKDKFKSFSCIMQGSLKELFTVQEQKDVTQIIRSGSLNYINQKFNLSLQRHAIFGYSITQKKHGEQRFHVGGQLPDGILKESIPAWGKAQLFFREKKSTRLVRNSYKDPVFSQDKKSRELKNRSRISIFDTFVSAVEKPVYSLSSGKTAVIYLGDARLTHIFYYNEGANKAIRDGQYFGRCLKTNGDFDVKLFEELTQHDFYAEEKRQNAVVLKELNP